MLKAKKWLIILLAVGILGAVAGGTAVAGTLTAPSQSPYQAFLGNLANTLGISRSTLTTDLQKAYTQTVNQEVASGRITQQQANEILARISNGHPLFGFMGMGLGPRVQGMGHNPRAMGGFMILKPLAGALGMTPQDLMAALSSGQTISALATAKGTSVAALQSTILSNIQSQLMSAVQNGRITQAQETQIYNNVQQSISSGNWVTQLQNICQARHWQPGGQQSTNS